MIKDIIKKFREAMGIKGIAILNFHQNVLQCENGDVFHVEEHRQKLIKSFLKSKIESGAELDFMRVSAEGRVEIFYNENGIKKTKEL